MEYQHVCDMICNILGNIIYSANNNRIGISVIKFGIRIPKENRKRIA